MARIHREVGEKGVTSFGIDFNNLSPTSVNQKMKVQSNT